MAIYLVKHDENDNLRYKFMDIMCTLLRDFFLTSSTIYVNYIPVRSVSFQLWKRHRLQLWWNVPLQKIYDQLHKDIMI